MAEIIVESVEEIDYDGDTYNLHIENNHNYFANNFNVSNCHLFKANSLTKIMEKLDDCPYRVGTTGTLDGSKTHQLVLEGLFGEVRKVTTTKDLMDNEQLSSLKIRCLALRYDTDTCKNLKGMKYKDEMDWIAMNDKRNKYIKNLCNGLKGNTLVLFNMVEKHGEPLYNLIHDNLGEDRPVYFVHGNIDSNIREKIRTDTEHHDNAIIVASYGTFSTGINIRNLHNIVFASPSKSKIRNLQSIGRVLRRSETKTSAVLYDIVDDLHHKKHRNFALQHFLERVKIYNDEKFNYKVFEIDFK